jgi:hypothetical protein
MKTVSGLAAAALVLATAGCLQVQAPPASYGYVSDPYRAQRPAPFVNHSPPTYYQPPPLSPNLTPETAPPPAVGTSTGRDQVRYLPAPQPPQSLLGPQRPGWDSGR